MKNDLKIKLVKNNGFIESGSKTFNKKKAFELSGYFAGECYDKEGFDHIIKEPKEKTLRRVEMTLNNGHHSVYGHQHITFNISNISKMLAMTLNNEKEYNTSEKSARYTPIEVKEGSIITKKEEELYNKWKEIFKIKIKERYPNQFKDGKVEKLALENARYLVTSLMPTEMIWTTSLRQVNYIVSWMAKYINDQSKKPNFNPGFQRELKRQMLQFASQLIELDVIDERLLINDKNRSLSLFNNDLSKKEEYFGDIYLTKYKASIAYLAQAQRHRTLNYEMCLDDNKSYFIPPIIMNDSSLKEEWLKDMFSVKDVHPQGELVNICESGTYDNFILKCKERLCSQAQLEINNQTKATLEKYKEELMKKDHYLKDDIESYNHGARCTFKDFKCSSDCNFNEGKRLIREI